MSEAGFAKASDGRPVNNIDVTAALKRLALPQYSLHQNADGSLSDPSAGKFIPAERHKNLYSGASIPHRPNYGRAPQGKPVLLRQTGDLLPLGEKTGTDDETIRNRLRVLAAVEDSVGKIFKVLQELKELDNTLIIFTSGAGSGRGSPFSVSKQCLMRSSRAGTRCQV